MWFYMTICDWKFMNHYIDSSCSSWPISLTAEWGEIKLWKWYTGHKIQCPVNKSAVRNPTVFLASNRHRIAVSNPIELSLYGKLCFSLWTIFFLHDFIWLLRESGATMHLQALSVLQQYNSNLEAFTQGALILILAVAIVTSNALIIATIVNFRGKFEPCQQSLMKQIEYRQSSKFKLI